MSLTEGFDRDGYALASGVLSGKEMDALRAEMDALIASAPNLDGKDATGAAVDQPEDFAFVEHDGGRVLQRISKQLARSRVMRIVYANPRLLGLVASVYGPSFVPFAESIIVKLPREGARVAWHQDGNRHDGIRHRGLNVGIYLQPSTEANGCLRVIPGSHRQGKIDVHALREAHGDILPGSIPLEAGAGDITLHDRSLVHGSLPNTSPDLRITVYFGYHRLDSIEPIHPPDAINRRASLVSLCIRERAASGWFPDEDPYDYVLADRAPAPDSDEAIETALREPALSL